MNVAVCPSCSASLLPGARFCSSCGARVALSSVARSRFMTVLFCDLGGSTRLTDTLGNEAMYEVITRYHAICNAVTAEYGGFVAKYMGDGMLAYFGYPQAMKNSAAPAVGAALEIIGRAGDIALPGGGAVSASAGVATGWMVVGDAHAGMAAAEALAVGGTVNLAARLQQTAEAGQVAVSGETGRRLEASQFALSPLGARNLRGFGKQVEVWLASRSEGSDLQRSFVGRRQKRAQLRSLWRAAREGHAAAVEISAPGGYGKTALAQVFLNESVDEGDVLMLRCEAHRGEQSFAPFRTLVRSLAGLDMAETPAAQRVLLDERAPDGGETGLALLCDLEEAQPAPVVRTELIFRALLALLDTVLREGPKVLFVEDAHWIDRDSARLIAALCVQCSDLPLLALITRRPEGTELDFEGLIPMPLDRIRLESAAELLNELDPDGAIDPQARDEIVERAQGVPLFLEHIAKAILERDSSGTGRPDTIPPTLIEALVERFDHVGDARELVEAAAVLGAEVRVDVLAAMIGRDQSEVSERITRLVRRGLFVPGGEGAVSFDHALIRDAVMQTLLRNRLTKLHETALAAYQAVAPERLENSPVTAATHLLGAGQVVAGIPRLLQAAQRSVTLGELAEAQRLLEWADRSLADVPEGPERDGLEMMVKFTLGLAMVQQRGFSDASVGEAYNRALELCLERGERGEAEFQIAWGIWAHYQVCNDVKRVEELTRRMVEIARDDPSLEVLAASAQSLIMCTQGRLEEQHALAKKVRTLYIPHLHRDQAAFYSQDSLELSLLFQVHGRFIAGDYQGWQDALREALDHEAFLEKPFLEPYIRIYSHAPFTYALSEEPSRPQLEAATALAGELGQPFWVIAGNLWLAQDKLRNSGPQAALADFEAAIAGMDGIGLRLGRAYHLASLAYCRARNGKPAGAEEAISDSLSMLDQGADLIYSAEVHRLSAEISLLADPGNLDGATECLDRADAIAREQGALGWSALIAGTRARMMATRTGRETAETWLQEHLAAISPRGASRHPAFLTAARAFTDPI
ncbi:AAA ATPase-like protein [Aliiruegeria haliotis]|uniref:AAA ATPase-like protein n=1 Tax=Aliiruegeria haliotis TaxID=1280846 RepID=A0A2T0RY87_9RHOB|nr:adenylate/guanylate cyclase domain-containing protein [Aliiruegeria haliotis]PRY26120.1 AAA ATPase-like protein [Aliiruegeria haliotis]